ncbi:MAG: 50S ribosomal protein L23 [Myxococcota bacterium]|jgi:large subunit ribosomal protein L23|nr:50S ribosomal protein L23 [Myxococcota bacterium]
MSSGKSKQKDVYQVLKRPVITEKSQVMKDELNQVTFEVHKDANKIDIARAVEQIFKVKVVKVNTQTVAAKPKRLGKHLGVRPEWKKATVTLAAGEAIDFYGEV